jgi:hypothetical protein
MLTKILIRYIFLIVFIEGFSYLEISAQKPVFFSEEELKLANTAVHVNYLSDEEKEVIKYMNLARMDGKKFFDAYIQQFVDQYNQLYTPKIKPNNKYVKSLKKDLYEIKQLPVIAPNKLLTKASVYHAKDMGKTGKTGHNSSDGATFVKRIKRITGIEYNISENCDYGFNKGLDIVCHLLIDNGISKVGHRKNILNSEQRQVGVSIQPHKIYKFNCVTDFTSNP